VVILFLFLVESVQVLRRSKAASVPKNMFYSTTPVVRIPFFPQSPVLEYKLFVPSLLKLVLFVAEVCFGRWFFFLSHRPFSPPFVRTFFC